MGSPACTRCRATSQSKWGLAGSGAPCARPRGDPAIGCASPGYSRSRRRRRRSTSAAPGGRYPPALQAGETHPHPADLRGDDAGLDSREVQRRHASAKQVHHAMLAAVGAQVFSRAHVAEPDGATVRTSRTQSQQRLQYASIVLAVIRDQEIDVLGRTNVLMGDDCESTDDDMAGGRRVERVDDAREVRRAGHRSRERRPGCHARAGSTRDRVRSSRRPSLDVPTHDAVHRAVG